MYHTSDVALASSLFYGNRSFRPKSKSFRPKLKSFRPNFKVVSFKLFVMYFQITRGIKCHLCKMRLLVTFKFVHFFSPISLPRPRHVNDAPADRWPIVFVKLIKTFHGFYL